ncbi:thymidylate kinase [Campylobacter mucosalis]|uniref:Thymidylate kinase n=1 Tax=Campylobacter mucosalis CCUG 21559 TaxID=1032067 RepID=A0A6G5QHC8_9BACT|nr:dTMP kinase [Campylobacter mucosalis]KEA46500.1 thymidylate kinase [Campylobacter mucosalis]QCD45088.1 dTMP kinase [Campylobacter mucosalis CCUG 21559]QKF63003.1 dTMP kinase [Campylobacter mucosalis]
MYVVFEGIDGVGKSTQIKLVAKKNPNTIITKEPGGSEFGKFAREILLKNQLNLSTRAEMLLFLADRAEHAKKVILPNQDKLILSDRSFISGVAYAKANDENLNFDELLFLNKFALDNTLPDKIIFFKTNKNLLLKRLSNRGTSDNIEKRGAQYLLNVQEIMDEFLQSLNIDVLKINADEKIDEIHTKIVNFLNL